MSVRKRGIATRQIDRIRKLNRQGLSTNQIQKTLQHQGLGLQRKTLLTYIRELRGRPAPAEWQKYIPKKYRHPQPPPPLPPFPMGIKQVCVYGTYHGRQKRIQVYGSGADIYQAMPYMIDHPPKQDFLTIDAESLLTNPNRYLDTRVGAEWDRKPYIES